MKLADLKAGILAAGASATGAAEALRRFALQTDANSKHVRSRAAVARGRSVETVAYRVGPAWVRHTRIAPWRLHATKGWKKEGRTTNTVERQTGPNRPKGWATGFRFEAVA